MWIQSCHHWRWHCRRCLHHRRRRHRRRRHRRRRRRCRRHSRRSCRRRYFLQFTSEDQLFSQTANSKLSFRIFKLSEKNILTKTLEGSWQEKLGPGFDPFQSNFDPFRSNFDEILDLTEWCRSSQMNAGWKSSACQIFFIFIKNNFRANSLIPKPSPCFLK